MDLDFDVGKPLSTPICSWFDLAETAGGDCSPNFVKINKDAFLPFLPLPENSCFCHWGSALTVPSASLPGLTDSYMGLPRMLLSPSGRICKAKPSFRRLRFFR